MTGARLAAIASVLLAGCASLPPPATIDPVAAAAAQQARATALGLAGGDCAAPDWALSGRVALANGREGGSGRLEWAQAAGHLRLLLTAPVTRQGWQLDVDAAGATLSGLEGGPRSGTDAARLLRDATGWDIPLAALGCWLRAVAAPASVGPAVLAYGPHQLPVRLEQGGWVVEYDGWAVDAASGQSLPTRVEARRGDDRVRLVVDRWGRE